MGNKYIMRNCYWCHEYQDMNATVPTCDYYGHFGRCPCKDECEHYISEPEVENIIRKRAETEWIPCSERLPEDTARPVLISGRHKTVGIYAVDIARYNGDMWQYDGFTFPDCEVLAWMPLPEPYKGGDEEPGQWQTENGKPSKAEYSVYCSKCGSWSEYRTKYCGNCGSLMKEENDEQ